MGEEIVNLNLIEQRKFKKNILIELIREKAPISRSALASLTKLSPSTVSIIVDELIQEGYVEEEGPGESSGGRKPILLDVREDGGYFIGVDFDATSVRGALVDFKLNVVDKVERQVEAAQAGLIIATIYEVISSLLVVPQNGRKVVGIGVGTPGIIERKEGTTSLYYNVEGWNQIPLKRLIESRFSLPVALENNIKLMAYGEYHHGMGKGARILSVLSGRAGVAAGIIINGEIFEGATQNAGEIGHISVNPEGPLCRCGRRGCIEAYTSSGAVLREARARFGWEGSINDLWAAANSGHKEALSLLEETARVVGKAVAIIFNLLNPEMLILAGHFAQGGEAFVEEVKRTISREALEIPARGGKVVMTSLGAFGGAVGAAHLSYKSLFPTS